MGSGASFDAGISSSSQDNHGRYFCHSCHRVFGIGGVDSPLDYYCPHCQSTFLEELGNNMFSEYNFGGMDAERGISVRHRSHGHSHTQLTNEQSRRISNATAMLRLLETQLRDELEHLQRAFQTASNRITAQNSQKTKKLTTVMLSKLRAVTVTLDMICSQPSCPICSEDFVVLPIAPSSSSAKVAAHLPSSSSSSVSLATATATGKEKAGSPSSRGPERKDQDQDQDEDKGQQVAPDESKEERKEDAKLEEKPDGLADADADALTCPLDAQAAEKKGDSNGDGDGSDLCAAKPPGEGKGEGGGGGGGEPLEKDAPSEGAAAAAAAAAPGPSPSPALLSGRGGPSTMEDDWLTQLPCSHLFHPNCIIPWMEMKQNCPICRYEISDKIFTVEEFTRLFSRYELVKKLQDLDVPVLDDPSVPSDDLAALLQKHLLRCQQSEQEADRLAAEREAERELLHSQQQQMVLSRERRARRLSHSRAEMDLAELSGGSIHSSLSRGGSASQLLLLDPSDGGRFPLSSYGSGPVLAATTPRQGHRRAHSMNAASYDGSPSNALVVRSSRNSSSRNSSSNNHTIAAAAAAAAAAEPGLIAPSIASSVASAALVFQSAHHSHSQSPTNASFRRGSFSTRSSFGHQRRISGTIPEGDAEAAPSSSGRGAAHGSALTQVVAADRARASLEMMSNSSVAATDGEADAVEVESLLSVPASSSDARLSSSSSTSSLAAAAAGVVAASRDRNHHGHGQGQGHGLSHSNSHGSNLSDASTASPSSLQMLRSYMTFSFPTVYSSSNAAPAPAATNSPSPMRRRI